MTTLLFSRTGDAQSVQNASTLAAQLRNMGQVIIVGIGSDALSHGLGYLASSVNAISWPDLTNQTGLSDQIQGPLSMKLL